MKRKTLTLIALALILSMILSVSVFVYADDDDAQDPADQEEETQEGEEENEETEEEVDIKEFAKRIALYCRDTETTLFEKESDQSCPTSATAKLMTALVAFDCFKDLEEEIVLSKDTLTGDAALLYGFTDGKSVTVYDLLAALLIRNSNEAANSLAKAAGGETAFISMMNEKAADIGMNDTRYSDVTGVSIYSSTTVSDMIKLAEAFAENDTLLSLSAMPYKKLASTGVNVYNRNYYFSSYYNGGRSYLNPEVIGGITGQTGSAGDTLIAITKHGSYTYICAISGGERDDSIYSYLIANELVDWGSRSFSYRTLLNIFDVICGIPIEMGNGSDEASVFPAKDVIRFISKDIDLEQSVSYTYSLDSERLVAPVAYADKVGSVTVLLDGIEIETVDLIVRSDVPSSRIDYMLSELVAFVSNPVFIRTVLIILALLALYILIRAMIRGQRQLKVKEKAELEKKKEEIQNASESANDDDDVGSDSEE